MTESAANQSRIAAAARSIWSVLVVHPLVSVIIPTFNRWPMVGEAVESVLAQSFTDHELIVVDDGSTDDTAKKLARLGTKLKLFIAPRKGVSAARNFGVSRSSGRYLALLDSDDLWRPAKLARQTAFMELHREYQICQTEEIWIRNGARVNPKAVHQKPSGDIFARSLDRCLVSPSAVMMTRRLFDRRGGFDESLPVCEDYDLWLRIAVEHEVPLIPEPLVIKRGGHADQLSRSQWGMDRYRVQALAKLLRGGLAGAQRTAAIAALRRKVRVLAHGARKRGKELEAATFEAILAEFDQERVDVGERNSRICQGEEFSPADA
ncbi:MAG: glycosyltransferase family 2 protein [Chloroflexota bacterium]